MLSDPGFGPGDFTIHLVEYFPIDSQKSLATSQACAGIFGFDIRNSHASSSIGFPNGSVMMGRPLWSM